MSNLNIPINLIKLYNNKNYKIPLISIKDFSLNIGIEIETCTTRKNENNKLNYFIDTKDGTIKCNDGFNPIEYIIKGYIISEKIHSWNGKI